MSKIEILSDVEIVSVKPYEKNCFNHKNNVANIAKSIKDFGYNKVSIGIDECGVLLYGHGTLSALKVLGWEKIPTVAKIVGLTDEQKNAYRMADNFTALGSRIEDEILKECAGQLEMFKLEDYGLPIEHQMTIDELSNRNLLEQSAERMAGYLPPEKMWMYVQFNTKEEWDAVVASLGKGNSRRIINADKLLGMMKDEVATDGGEA